MQPRPPQPPAARFTPPTAPGVPIHAMQNLIPRLATAINDIDGLKNTIAMGNADGSMPNWDTLLQRYSMLLGRVQQLSAYIAQEARSGPGGLPPMPGAGGPTPARPPAPSGPGGAAGPSGAGGTIEKTVGTPALSHYLVHALRPLPADCGPVAPEVLFQVINTMELPDLAAAQTALLKTDDAPQSFLSLPGQVKLQPLDALRKLDDPALTRLTGNMRSRLQREHHRATAMLKEIARREEEYDWKFRINEDEDDDEKDDLFDEDDDEGDAKMAEPEAPKVPNPREGWKVTDYLRFLDNGTRPPPAPGAQDPGAGAAVAAAAAPIVI